MKTKPMKCGVLETLYSFNIKSVSKIDIEMGIQGKMPNKILSVTTNHSLSELLI